MSFGIPVRNGLMLGLGASTALSAGRGLPIPALSLNFLSGTLDSRITFSRGTNATLIDSTGRLTYAPNNLVQRSQELQDVYWIKLAVTATGDVTTAPDGTTTADKVVATASAFTRRLLYANATLSASTNIFSFYAKASEYSLVRAVDSAGGSRWFASFDVSNGTVVGGTTGGAQFVSAGISDAENGWYRCWVVFNAAAGAGAIGMVGYPAGASLDQFGVQYAGDGTSGAFFWGLQLEQVTYQTTPSTYAVTTSALYYGPRFDYDPVTLQPRGLLIEEARTNFVLQSNALASNSDATVTAAAATSPDGATNAYRITKSNATDPVYSSQSTSMTVAANTAYTASRFVKYDGYNTTVSLEYNVGANWGNVFWNAQFAVASTGVTVSSQNSCTATVTNFGNGWYRLTATFTTGATITTPSNPSILLRITGGSGVTVLGYGVQLEAGAFATSYIPTVASTVTRNADVATMTGTNFSSWYNQSEGTFVAAADSVVGNLAAINIPVSASDGTFNNFIRTYIFSGVRGASVTTGGVTQADLSVAGHTSNAIGKWAFACKVNDFALSVNGAAALTDTAGTVPVVDRLGIGSFNNTNQLNGHVRTIAYFNTRLPDDRLVALSR